MKWKCTIRGRSRRIHDRSFRATRVGGRPKSRCRRVTPASRRASAGNGAGGRANTIVAGIRSSPSRLPSATSCCSMDPRFFASRCRTMKTPPTWILLPYGKVVPPARGATQGRKGQRASGGRPAALESVALPRHPRCPMAEAKTKAELAKELQSRRPALIDVREKQETDQGILPGAKLVPRGYLELRIEETLPDRDAEVVLYCAGGTRSLLAGRTLREMGYRKVRSLQGGYGAWKDGGLPVEVP